LAPRPNASYSLTLRCEISNRPGQLGRLASAIGEVEGDIGAIDIVRVNKSHIVRDVVINARDEDHGRTIVEHVRHLAGFRILHVSDRTFLMHMGGKIEVRSKVPVRNREELSMAYTPGVARICRAIAADRSRVYQLTIKRNTVAVVTDGSAVLGLGNIGAEAAMPVMEGKALLFKEFAGVDAFPLCLDTQDPDEIVRVVKAIAPGFGGINLEDIAAPRCFDIEDRLKALLDIPVFHDDQHGTAVVVLAALINALRIVRKPIDRTRVVISGMGAAGIACARILVGAGAAHIVGCDRQGAIHSGRELTGNPAKQWIASHTNQECFRGTLGEALEGADVFIGVSAPNLVTPDDVRSMGRDPIVFALANPDPEILPDDLEGLVRVMATGRSDYPNQINNVLCFPGIFRGAFECQASQITEQMKLAAAHAIAECIAPDELTEEYVVPSVFNKRVASKVADAVVHAAISSGVARRHAPRVSHELLPADAHVD
jgi:malate dehydrogenase (oxaloacetate-decarboxylating)